MRYDRSWPTAPVGNTRRNGRNLLHCCRWQHELNTSKGHARAPLLGGLDVWAVAGYPVEPNDSLWTLSTSGLIATVVYSA